MKTKIIALQVLLLSFLTGCGSGVDPLSLMTDDAFPPLETIIQNTGLYTSLNTPYTKTTPYWTFAAFGAVNYISPQSGIVAEQGVESGLNFVRIIHSGRLATKILGLNTITVRSGDRVAAGQIIGLFSNVPVQFQVLVDGSAVCPLSYMSTTFRGSFYAGITSNPCQN